MARHLLEPILDGGVSNPHYFEGRLLTASALHEDQQSQRAHDRRLGRALGVGVVHGLWVSIDFAGAAAEAPRIAVTAGLAINADGDTLELPAREIVALARAATPPNYDAAMFHACEPPLNQIERPGDAFYVVVLSPASGFVGRAPFHGLSDPRAGAGCGSRWAVEGVRLRMVAFDPLTVPGLTNAIRQQLETTVLQSTNDAGRAKLRNLVAHLCLGTEPLQTFAIDPFARDPVPGNGTEPALAAYGVVDHLVESGVLSTCDVPIALLHWPTASPLSFVDNWAVRRRLAPAAPSPALPTLHAARRRAEAEAVLFQFQEQLASLIDRFPTPTTIRLIDFFRWMPPAAVVPIAGGGRRGVMQSVFMNGVTTRDPVIYIDGARLEELIAISLTQSPVDLQAKEFVWTYRVRQNDLLPSQLDTEFPYFVIASGHMPYVGSARFDVARFDRSNYEPL